MSQDVKSIDNFLDLQNAMGNLDGDVELLQEILEIFLDIVPEQIDELEAFIQAGKVSEVDILSHSLKGSASNFCASRFVGVACQLEHLAKAGSLEGAEELHQQLKAEFAELQNAQTSINWEDILKQWSP